MQQRVSVIGLDGATFRLILPWVQAGRLPTLKKIMSEGAWGVLKSTIHPLSPQAWASFMTGTNPGKHGIFEFVEHRPNSYELRYLNGGFVQGRKLWELLSNAGKRVCVINVPFTYPPVPVNGYLVAGLDAPGPHSEFCYPSELLADLTQKFGEYQLRQHPYRAKPETYLQKILNQFDHTLKVAKYLKEKEPWDFFMVVFEATDLVQHFYWHYAFPEEFGLQLPSNEKLAQAIYQVYSRIDQGLGDLLSLCEADETVMVMSDHGFSPCRKIIFMDRWLHDQGYLEYRQENQKSFTLARACHLAFQKYFPNRLKGWITSQAPRLRDHFRSYLTTATIDWRKTRAFSLGIDSTNIFINQKGRFPAGIVEAGDEYEQLRDEIVDGLKDLINNDTGERIVEKVYKCEELYHGENLDKAPDLLVTWKNFEYNTRRGYGKENDDFLGSSLDFSDVSKYSSLKKSGTHHTDGIFLGYGPCINASGPLQGTSIVDLAPTILYLLGNKVPRDMDGRILNEIIRDDLLATYNIRSDPAQDSGEGKSAFSYSKEEEEYIKDKLRGLGYIDWS